MARVCERWCQSKKLEEAAEFWAKKTPANNDDVSSDLAVFGLSENESAMQWLAQVESVPADEPFFIVLPENEQAIRVFCAVQTNWNLIVGMASCSYLGLDYKALHSVLQMLCIPRKRWPELFNDIRVMEQAALPLLNAKN